MEAVAIGDLHMTTAAGTGGLAKYVPDHDKFVAAEVRAVCDWATKEGIEHVFYLGDLCDGPRMSYEAQGQLIGIHAAYPNLKFWAILGNHDMFSRHPEEGHSLELLRLMKTPNFKIITKPKTIDIDGAPVRFLPFPHTKFDPKALNIFHHEVQGSKNDAGRKFESDELPKSKAVCVAGHLHTPHQVRNTLYPGTLYQTNFGEAQKKFFVHIHFNGPDDYEFTMVPHKPKYVLHTIVLESRKDLKLIPKERHDLVKLVLSEGCDVNVSDYAKHQNIVVVKSFKTQEELAAVIAEDMQDSQALLVNVEEFFDVWLQSTDFDEDFRNQIKRVRQRALKRMNK